MSLSPVPDHHHPRLRARPPQRPALIEPRNHRRLSFSGSASGSASGRAHVSSPPTPSGRRPAVNATAACTNRPRALLSRL